MAVETVDPISALLLCMDPQIVPVAVPVLHDLKVITHDYVTCASAIKALGQTKFDLVILDLDLFGAGNAIDLAAGQGKTTPVIVLSKEVETLQAVASKPVHFAWKKPVPKDVVLRDLKAACGMARSGSRPAYRIPVNIEASANVYGTKGPLNPVMITNLNAGGLCLKSKDTLPPNATVAITFRLPESKATIHAMGKIIWDDRQSRIGVHFSFVPPAEREQLQRWVTARTPAQSDLLNQMLTSQVHPSTQAKAAVSS